MKTASATGVRNLLYNCCALAHSEEWVLNVQKLNQYAGVFNGRKLVILRTGDRLVAPGDVKKEFSFDVEFIELPNSTRLQEVSGFIEVLSKLENTNANEKTFYAHTKGVRYKVGDPHIPSIRMWRDVMYESCLSDMDRIDEVLGTYSCCGCFKQRTGSAWDREWSCAWVFSGTFWWVNHAPLFSRPDWRSTADSPYGIEAYLGRLFPQEQGFCLTGPLTTDPYTMLNEPWKRPARRPSRIRNSRLASPE